MKTAGNPNIPTPVRTLLQRLTIDGSELELHSDTRDVFLNLPGHASERLINSQEKAAKDALRLCLVETSLRRHPIYFYRLSREGLRCLLDRNHRPTILRAPCLK